MGVPLAILMKWFTDSLGPGGTVALGLFNAPTPKTPQRPNAPVLKDAMGVPRWRFESISQNLFIS